MSNLDGNERCQWCGFVFMYDDDTTFAESHTMIATHFNEQHASSMPGPGRVVHDLGTRTVWYEALESIG